MKPVIIVESPAKAKTISQFLGRQYSILSSMGHIRDLPRNSLGVSIDDAFKPTYEVIKNKKKIVKALRDCVKTAKEVFIATDQDREGEAIGWHIIQVIRFPIDRVKRIVFHEITQNTILYALKHARKIDMNLVEAQQARRILDRLVGYKISPLLAHRIRRGLSAGRVQSVALRLIIEREREISSFTPKEFWTIEALFRTEDIPPFSARLTSIKGAVLDKFAIPDKDRAEHLAGDIRRQNYRVHSVLHKTKQKSPLAPYITSTLQQDAAYRLGFYAKKTMDIAQKLYEGIPCGERGNTGLITYMRTDSLHIADSAQKTCQSYIVKTWGPAYAPKKPRHYRTKVKNAQEAHEAIRPTDVTLTPGETAPFLNSDQLKLYELIWKRFVASQMSSALINTSVLNIEGGPYVFRANGQHVKFSGFLKVYDMQMQEESIPPLETGSSVELHKAEPQQHYTEPPPHYNEASLIKTLEDFGIGRPSTYAPIINTLMQRGYVTIIKKVFIPQDIGYIVNDALIAHFPHVFNTKFTAHMEQDLDKIALGNITSRQVLNSFYSQFEKTLQKAQKDMKTIKNTPTEEICSVCGSPMVIKMGKFGRFLSCGNFPKCRNSVSLDDNGQKVVIPPDKTLCQKCGKPMVIKTSRRGRFLACSGYPECKNTVSM